MLDAILREIENQGYTQRQLVEILDEYQPSVSNLIRGKIAKVSVEKLLTYSDRLQIKTTLTVHARSGTPRGSRIRSGLLDRSSVGLAGCLSARCGDWLELDKASARKRTTSIAAREGRLLLLGGIRVPIS